MIYTGRILRLTLAALTAMWVPSWCYCAVQVHSAPSPVAAAAGVPADDCCAAGEPTSVQSADLADRAAGEGYCCPQGPAGSQGCHTSGGKSGNHECDSCGQNASSPYVDARPAKANPAELAPAFVAPAALSLLPTVTDSLYAKEAHPFDITDGPPQTSLFAQFCLLTI